MSSPSNSSARDNAYNNTNSSRHTNNEPIPQQFSLDEAALAKAIFKPFAYQFAPKKDYDELSFKAAQNFGKPGRDPLAIGEMMASLTGNSLWREKMASAKLFQEWGSIVGEGMAQNCRVSSYKSGVVTISAVSPAWATQLGYMKEQIESKIREVIPSLAITEIRITGPQPEPFRRKRY